MSGKLWMFSDQLDDEDLKFARHSFFRYADGIVYYRLTEKTITRLAKNGMIKKTQLDALKKFNYENLTEFSVTQVLNDAVSTKEDDGKVVLSRRELDKYFSKTVETDKRKEVILDLLDRWKRGQKRP